MLTKINGLPGHILLVHAVVILIPLAAILAIAGSVWPAARRRLGVLTPLAALVGLVFIPLATSSGEWLQERVPETSLLDRHTAMGDGLTVWAILLFVITSALWLLDRGQTRSWRIPPALLSGWVRPVASAVLVAVAVVSVVQVYRIGDSGAKAAWDGRFTGQPGSGDG